VDNIRHTMGYSIEPAQWNIFQLFINRTVSTKLKDTFAHPQHKTNLINRVLISSAHWKN